MCKHRQPPAFTLVEVMIASAVVLLAAAALIHAITSSQMITYAALHNSRANSLAGDLLEEILALPYHDPDGGADLGPEIGEVSRADFDNIDDFNLFLEAAGAVLDAAGNGYPDEFDPFSRRVMIQNASVTVPGFSAAIDGLNVVVVVEDDRGRVWEARRFVPEP